MKHGFIFLLGEKNKYLPPAPGEKATDVYIPDCKIRSKCVVPKNMFMGIVAPPHPEKKVQWKNITEKS